MESKKLSIEELQTRWSLSRLGVLAQLAIAGFHGKRVPIEIVLMIESKLKEGIKL